MARGRGRGKVGANHGGRNHGGGGKKAPGRGKTGGNFLAPRSERQATKAANAAANTEYNPGIRETREEIAGSRKRQGDLGQWYSQLASDYQAAQGAGSAALASVGSITAAQEAEAAQRSQSEQAELGAQDEAFASLTGGPKDTTGLATIAAAGAAAERSRVDEAKLPVSEQANFVARLGSDKVAARLKGVESRQEEQRRREKLKSNLAAQRKEKGSARVAGKEKIRESDRSYATELAQLKLAKREARTAEQAAAASAALAQLKANHEATEDSIANRQAQERIGVSRSNAKISAKNARATAKNSRTSARAAEATAKHYEEENSGKLSTAEKRARGEHSADAMAAAKALLGIKVPKSAKQWAQFEAALIEKLGSSYAAQAAEAVKKIRSAQANKGRRGYDKRVRKGEAAGPPTPR
jgi:hypothetical protein